MDDNISKDLLVKLSIRINAQLGLYFSKKNWITLKRGLRLAAVECGFDDTKTLAHWLLSSPFTQHRIASLACHLTIGETYFFREMKAFDALKDCILPEFISARRNSDKHIRIWSAGCSSGEEPYSIAILLSRILPDIRSWKVTILAIDLNSAFLQKAIQGVYTDWSFRKSSPWLQTRYFKKSGNKYEIVPHIKNMVTFAPLNLAEDVYPSVTNDTNAMDIIFCRNVLMYFSDALRKRVIQHFHHALRKGGWLVVSPSEATNALFPQFTAMHFPGTIFFRNAQEQLSNSQRGEGRYLGTVERLSPPPFAFAGHGSEAQEVTNRSSASCFVPSQEHQRSQTPCVRSQGGPLVLQGNSHQERSPSLATPSSKVWYNRAVTLYEQGQYEDTIELLCGMSNLLAHQHAMELVIRAYANLGQFVDALEWCQKAIILDKLNPYLYYLRASVLIEKNQWQDAVTALRQTLFLDPHFVPAYLALGHLTLKQGKLNESKKHLENVQLLLQTYQPDDLIPGSEGMTAERLQKMVKTMLAAEVLS